MTAQETGGWIADDATLGARLALVRQHEGWNNLKEGAVACGVAPSSWRTYERDSGNPRRYLEFCQRVSYVSGCDYGWLVDRRPSGGPWLPPDGPGWWLLLRTTPTSTWATRYQNVTDPLSRAA